MQVATDLARSSFLVHFDCMFNDNTLWNKGYHGVQSTATFVVPFDLGSIRIHEVNTC